MPKSNYFQWIYSAKLTIIKKKELTSIPPAYFNLKDAVYRIVYFVYTECEWNFYNYALEEQRDTKSNMSLKNVDQTRIY